MKSMIITSDQLLSSGKKIILLLAICCFIGCKSKKQTVVVAPEPKITKVPVVEVAPEVKDKAYELGRRVLMTCNISKFKPFNSNEATPSVIKNMTKERLTKTCLKFRLKYGDFRDLELQEILKDKKQKTTVFRYKAMYEKKIANKELRVTMNESNQVSAIKSLDWVNTPPAKEKKPATPTK
jgi:hypothetical protein